MNQLSFALIDKSPTIPNPQGRVQLSQYLALSLQELSGQHLQA